MKTSFILHTDSLDILDALTTEQCGQLLIAMRDYHITGELPQDIMLKVALMPFVQQWKRDTEKWERIAQIRREHGSKGGKAKATKAKQKLVSDSKSYQEVANDSKSSLNGNVNVNVNVNDSVNVKEKESTRFAAPTLDEVKEFFKENGYTLDSATKAFTYYSEAQWRDSRGQTVKNWKQKMRGVWFRDEHKAQAAQASQPYNPRAGSVPAVYTSPENYRPA
jgi:hypothetical protein